MKAVVFRDVGDIGIEDVPNPTLEQPTDAVVRLTASAICGTDLHFVRGTMHDVEPGTVLGHEGVGIVEEVGSQVRNFRRGDRVVISSTISCGYCSYCRAGYNAQCDNANPHSSAPAFFGGPKQAGGYQGLQAERARIPFANTTMVKLPDEISDDQAITLSDIFPTGYFGADLARIKPGETVAVLGCGPVGQFTIASAILMNAGRVFAVDHLETRLSAAANQGAETIDFSKEDPANVLRELTGGIGPDRVIDAVGVEAERHDAQKTSHYAQEIAEIAPKKSSSTHWQPGNAPTAALEVGVEAIAKAGTMSIIGLYPQSVRWFPIGAAMMKNLKINMGVCNHRRYIPKLVELVRSGALDPTRVLSRIESIDSAVDAYEAFDERRSGWMKVELRP